MIDATQITNFSRNREDLLEFWLFCMMVANKPANITSQKLELLLSTLPHENSEQKFFDLMKQGNLLQKLQEIRSGQYSRLVLAFTETYKRLKRNKDYLLTASPEDLETIPGVGPKTARFFILHSRKNAHVAVLDTHVLKWLRTKGHEVPKSSPKGKIYSELESLFLKYAMRFGVTPADLDLAIWNTFSKNSGDQEKISPKLKEILGIQ